MVKSSAKYFKYSNLIFGDSYLYTVVEMHAYLYWCIKIFFRFWRQKNFFFWRISVFHYLTWHWTIRRSKTKLFKAFCSKSSKRCVMFLHYHFCIILYVTSLLHWWLFIFVRIKDSGMHGIFHLEEIEKKTWFSKEFFVF